MEPKRLFRSNDNRVIAGVFGGLGEYFSVDPVILRVTWVVLVIFTAFVPGILAYILAAIIIPRRVVRVHHQETHHHESHS